MRTFRILVGLVGLVALAGIGLASDWPHLRGPDQDGRAAGAGSFDREAFDLAVAWKRPLGSGYSGIAVAGDVVVTMAADDGSDVVVALDASTGEPRWKTALDTTYVGHDGSDDGPLSSPVIDGETVYALAPRGALVALRLTDGEQIWKLSLPDSTGSVEPFYGFTTTPIVVGDLLVVQAGGDDGAFLVGLDKRTGERMWSAGDAKVEYQSPTLMTLRGRPQVVAGGEGAVYGIDPADGGVVWRHELPEEKLASMNPVPLGGNAFLAFIGGEAIRFELGEDGTLTERFRTRELGNTFAAPVLHEGHLYGFRRNFLTCVDATTGERVWKSRPPGGRGLILVGDKLVVFGAQGAVVAADASPEEYRELARVDALERSGYTWPSFANGRIFVRSLEEIAAIEPVTADAADAETTDDGSETIEGDHLLARFVRRLEAADDKTATIDAFLEEHPRWPIVEGDLVHFVYRGDVEDIALAGSMLPNDVQKPLQRVDGTDLYHVTLRVEPGARVTYHYQVDFDAWVPDPNNPRRAPALWGDGEMSVVDTAGRPPAAHLAELPDGPRGRVEELVLESEVFGEPRTLQVYLPPGYDASEARYPTLIVTDGPAWLEKGRLDRTLDHLVGDRIAPVIAVFVPRQDAWWLEAGGSRTEDFVRMLADEVVPRIDSTYRTVQDPASRAVMGTSGYGLAAAVAALERPDVFGKVAVESVSLDELAGTKLRELLDAEGRQEIDWYVGWSRYEDRSIDRGYDLRDDGRRLKERLEDEGYRVRGGESLDGHGWDAWRSRADRLLVALYPKA